MNIPEGWQLVPKEPTPEMLLASKFCTAGAKSVEACDCAIYAAMLAAAPTPQESAPPLLASQNSAESDPSATPDCAGAVT